MSITSSNNLAVNNSLTVNGNTVLGTNSSNSLICNATTTFHNPLTLNGNFVQNSGTLSTTSDTNYLNGNVVIGGSKTLTTGSGNTTINGFTQANDNIYIASGKSLYIANSLHTQYIRNHHNGTDAYIDYTGILNLRKETTTTMSIASSDNKVTFPYGVISNGTLNVSGTSSFAGLNCTSINNSGVLSTGPIELSHPSFANIDMKTLHYDYDVRIGCDTGNASTGGQGRLIITAGNTVINSPLTANSGTFSGITNNTNALTNNSTLTQVGLANFTNNIRVNSGGSVYVTDAGTSNYLRMHHSGASSFMDFTGDISFRNGGATIPLTLNSGTNQGTFNYNLNTTGITNSATNAITNNGILYQNNVASFSSAITAPSISSSGTFYAGSGGSYDTTAITAPKITNGIASGTGDGATYTNFNLGINSWQGVGFVYSNPAGPSVCKMVIDNRSGNITTQGDITCNSVVASTALTIPSVVSNGSIYMANASPIYLKSVGDPNHYIKYDLTNEGPQLGFYGATTMKCTDNNEIIMKVSKTAVDINANTTITGDCVISNKCTIQNGTVLNGEINQSKYFTLKGYTINNSTPTTFYVYTKFDGSTANSASENLQMHADCLCTKITYAYNSTYPSNVFHGVREYVIYGNNFSGIDTAWSVGSTNYPPIITCNAYGLINIEFPKNVALTGGINWSFSILMM